MPSKQTIPYSYGIFFISFTCFQWLPLIDKVNGYDIVYKWYDQLISHGHYINGYVIMPNHIHTLISFTETHQRINTIVGNGKRFMAYEIIKRLNNNNETQLLTQLAASVEANRKLNNKKHEVWQISFDWKECNSNRFIHQKLDYIHANPCKGKWNLSKSPGEYKHSSAQYYETGINGIYPVKNIMEMEDMLFKKKQ